MVSDGSKKTCADQISVSSSGSSGSEMEDLSNTSSLQLEVLITDLPYPPPYHFQTDAVSFPWHLFRVIPTLCPQGNTFTGPTDMSARSLLINYHSVPQGLTNLTICWGLCPCPAAPVHVN